MLLDVSICSGRESAVNLNQATEGGATRPDPAGVISTANR